MSRADAHRKVVKQAMRAAEHIGLADFPDATNEREAMQMYMATLYGFVDATSPEAVAHLNAWQYARQTDDASNQTTGVANILATAPSGTDHTKDSTAAGTANGVNEANGLVAPLAAQATHDDASHTTTPALRAGEVNGRRTLPGAAAPEFITPEADNVTEMTDRRPKLDPGVFGQRLELSGLTLQAGEPSAARRDAPASWNPTTR